VLRRSHVHVQPRPLISGETEVSGLNHKIEQALSA